MGFQMQIGSILCFSWSILVKFCIHLRMSSRKTQMPLSSGKDYILQILTVLLEIHNVYI